MLDIVFYNSYPIDILEHFYSLFMYYYIKLIFYGIYYLFFIFIYFLFLFIFYFYLFLISTQHLTEFMLDIVFYNSYPIDILEHFCSLFMYYYIKLIFYGILTLHDKYEDVHEIYTNMHTYVNMKISKS